MKCIIPGELYLHRGCALLRCDDGTNKGITADGPNPLLLFRTFADARRYIDMTMDGTHDRVPVPIGEWVIPEGWRSSHEN